MFIPVSLGYIIAAKSARASVIEHAIDRPKTIGNFFSRLEGCAHLPEAARALLNLMLGDVDNVDLEIVEL